MQIIEKKQPDVILDFPVIKFRVMGDVARYLGEMEFTALSYFDKLEINTCVYVKTDPIFMQYSAQRKQMYEKLERWYIQKGLVMGMFSFEYHEKGFNVTQNKPL